MTKSKYVPTLAHNLNAKSMMMLTLESACGLIAVSVVSCMLLLKKRLSSNEHRRGSSERQQSREPDGLCDVATQVDDFELGRNATLIIQRLNQVQFCYNWFKDDFPAVLVLVNRTLFCRHANQAFYALSTCDNCKQSMSVDERYLKTWRCQPMFLRCNTVAVRDPDEIVWAKPMREAFNIKATLLVAELLIPVDQARQVGLSADELLSYISANFTAVAIQAPVNDVKAIICFLYETDLQPPAWELETQPFEDGPLTLEEGELRTRNVCYHDTPEIPRLSVAEEANVFLSGIFKTESPNIRTPIQPIKTAVKKVKENVVSHHKGDLKRTIKKVKSTALRAELKEFAKQHNEMLYLALDQHNVAWLNRNFNMKYMVLREALLLYQHRITRESVKYPKKMLSYYLSKVV